MSPRCIAERWLLVGHRGAGKTQFLRAVGSRFEKVIDLDEEIVKRRRQSIGEIFDHSGEKGFRRIEEEVFRQILNEMSDIKSCLIALGAGYAGTLWPREFKTLWIRRETDIWPRYFFDRPPVGTSVETEFFAHYLEREERYQKWADVVWTIPEGEGVVIPLLREWPLEHPQNLDAILTLMPQLHRNPEEAIELRKNLGLTFEVRTDLWPQDRLKKLLEKPSAPILLSIRTQNFSLDSISSISIQDCDWDLSLGEPPSDRISILSLHDFSDGLGLGLAKLSHYKKFHLKASPIVERWEDLEFLWRWWKEDPSSRSVLPRGKVVEEVPRWQWFRLYMKGKQKLNFLREGGEGLRDQPTLQQWMDASGAETFGAVIGDPVVHSFSPVFHREFFKSKGSNFYAIPIAPKQLSSFTMKFLQELGAWAFAVTSPHKEIQELAKFAGYTRGGPINTLVKVGAEWKATSTDSIAMKNILSKAPSWNIFGAGAMGRMAFHMAANAALYSARERNKIEEKGNVATKSPLLWVAGDEAPIPRFLDPLEILDLSYAFRSQARLFALEKKINYVGGVEFFTEQALEQQKFWNKEKTS